MPFPHQVGLRDERFPSSAISLFLRPLTGCGRNITSAQLSWFNALPWRMMVIQLHLLPFRGFLQLPIDITKYLVPAPGGPGLPELAILVGLRRTNAMRHTLARTAAVSCPYRVPSQYTMMTDYNHQSTVWIVSTKDRTLAQNCIQQSQSHILLPPFRLEKTPLRLIFVDMSSP